MYSLLLPALILPSLIPLPSSSVTRYTKTFFLNKKNNTVNVENGTRVAAPGHNVPYWTYTGSLTTPPCTEGVTYIVSALTSILNPMIYMNTMAYIARALNEPKFSKQTKLSLSTQTHLFFFCRCCPSRGPCQLLI